MFISSSIFLVTLVGLFAGLGGLHLQEVPLQTQPVSLHVESVALIARVDDQAFRDEIWRTCIPQEMAWLPVDNVPLADPYPANSNPDDSCLTDSYKPASDNFTGYEYVRDVQAVVTGRS